MRNDNNTPKKPKRPVFYYYIGAIILWSIVSSILFPYIASKQVKEVNYSEFLTMVEEGTVKEVNIEDERIDFKALNKDGKEEIYSTGNMKLQDPELVHKLAAKGVSFNKVIPKEFSPIVKFLIQFILPLVVIFGLMQLLMSSVTKKMGGNSLSFGKNNAKIYVKSTDGKTFKDVAGQDEAKEALLEIVDFLHDPKKYSDIGATLPKGALLVGPPGTGKTLLAQAVAGEANVPFFSMSGSEFVEIFAGMGASKVRDLFKQAEEKAPCLIFIDEIDAIGKKRDSSGFSGNDEREQTLNQLLNEMDGFNGTEGVVILAATNRPEILDPALTRPGRFDRRIPVELPDVNGREAILQVHARKVKTEPNIDYRAIALATAGASGAQLANIVNEAALHAIRFGRNRVAQEDLQESVEVVIAGQQKKGMVISQKEKEMIAYHEVGHALVAAMQTHSAPVTKITIIPRTSGALGYTMQVEEEEKVLMSKEDLFNKIVTYTGGRTAEELIFNTKTTGASNDIEMATKLAKAMVTRYGMTDEFGMVALETGGSQYLGGDSTLTASQQKAGQIDDKVESIIKEAHEKATKILSENMEKLHEISKYLIEKENITGEEFMDILQDKYILTPNPNKEDIKEEIVVEETNNKDNNDDINIIELGKDTQADKLEDISSKENGIEENNKTDE